MPVNRVLLCISFLVFFTVLPTGEINAQEQILDDFETPGGWKIIVSDGVTLNITSDKGFSGNAIIRVAVLGTWFVLQGVLGKKCIKSQWSIICIGIINKIKGKILFEVVKITRLSCSKIPPAVKVDVFWIWIGEIAYWQVDID